MVGQSQNYADWERTAWDSFNQRRQCVASGALLVLCWHSYRSCRNRESTPLREAKKDIEARERGRKRYEQEEKLKDWVQQNPGYRLVRRDGRLFTEQRPKEENPTTATAAVIAAQPVEKKPVNSTAQVRERINDMIRQNLPALSKVYNEAMKKEAEKQVPKKQPQKETLSTEAEKKAI
jgi:hypothetical protein